MDEIILYRLSFFLPKNDVGRYWVLNLKDNKISKLEDKFLKKNVQIQDENGNWQNSEVDYKGYYCIEKTLFSEKIDFSVYTNNGEDIFLYNKISYNLNEIELFYNKGFLFDCFLIKHKDEILKVYRYLRPIWRLLLIEDDDGDSVYPLKYIIKFIDKKSWKYKRRPSE